MFRNVEVEITMTIMYYLFNYVLKNYCHGNKSEFARQLGSCYIDLQKRIKRFDAGGGSANTMEALLHLCRRENISIDKAIKEYTPEIEAAEELCTDVRQMRLDIDRHYYAAKDLSRLLTAADAFMGQLEKTYCTAACRKARNCATECPCNKFAEYWQWLHNETLSRLKNS